MLGTAASNQALEVGFPTSCILIGLRVLSGKVLAAISCDIETLYKSSSLILNMATSAVKILSAITY